MNWEEEEMRLKRGDWSARELHKRGRHEDWQVGLSVGSSVKEN